MKAIGDIGFDLDKLKPTDNKKKSKLSTHHQVEGVRIAKALGAEKASQFSQIIGLYKTSPALVDRAYSFAIDYPGANNRLGIFFWRYWQLKKGIE